MKYLSQYLFVCAFLISQLNLAQKGSSQFIQNPSGAEESIFIHYNSSFFLPGESLQYSLYNLNEDNLDSKISRIAHVALLNSNQEAVFKHTLDLQEGAGYSDFLIPSSLPSGTYKLIGYTNWMDNYENSGIFMADIFILNPYLEQEKGKILKEENYIKNVGNTSISNEPAEAFEIKLDREDIGHREKVTLELDLSESELEASRLSVSIRKLDSTVMARPLSSVQKSKKRSGNFSFKTLPEYRGRHLKGLVLNSNEEPVNRKLNLAYSVARRPDKFRIFSTDNQGKFNFQLSDLVDYSTGSLKVLSEDKEGFKFRKDSIKLDLGSIEFPKIPLNDLDQERLRERIVHHQIEQYYRSVKSDSLMSYAASNIFYGNRATRYILDDYTRFSTMDETFVEIINFVSFRNDGDRKVIKISDFQNPNATGGVPLILVDGIAITDHMDVYGMNPNTIESISVLIDKYYYGPAFYQGVLDIRTKNQNFGIGDDGFALKIQPVEKDKEYYSPEYSKAENGELSRIPDYRYQLLWLPEVSSKKLDFYTSDISGNFEVRIEGFLKNGDPVSISKEFQVSDKL